MASVGVPPALIAFYADHESPVPVVEEYAWSELVALLTEHELTDCSPCPGGQKCTAKFSMAFAPGAPRPGTTRLNKNVDQVSLLVFDFDHLTRAELEALTDRLDGLECVLYSTHSHLHGGPDDCCVRVVFPLPRPLKPSEFRWVRNGVIAKYQLQWFRDPLSAAPKLVGADPNPKDLSRLFFLPTAPVGVPTEAGHQEGALLDLQALLAGMPAVTAPRPSVAAPPRAAAPLGAPTVDLEALRGLLKDYRPREDDEAGEQISKKELVRRVYKGEALVKPEEEGQRERSCHRLGKILAYLLPVGTPDEVMVELCRMSINAMPAYDTDGAEDTIEKRFEKLDFSWRRGLGEREEQQKTFEAQRLEEKQAATKLRQWLHRAKRAPTDAPTAPTDAPTEPAEEETPLPTEEELLAMLVSRPTKNGSIPIACLANVIVILSLHPEWEGLLRFNEITKNVETHSSSGAIPLYDYETAPSSIVSGVKNWLQLKFSINFSTADVLDGLVHVAKGNAYNPLKTFLESAVTDGVPRIDTFLEFYCGASLVGVDGSDISVYARTVSRRWLVACVARALNPGCKMDNLLILEGKTGIYKSTALRVLGGPFFSDSKITIGEKDAMQLAGTNWLHEIAELSGLHAADTEQQKAFFSSPVDQFRAPYDKVPEKYPRLAVFVGSTNDTKYLNDHTGNRRPWPIRCEKPFRIRELKVDRSLLWAEAVQVYKAAATCLKCQALNIGVENWFTAFAHERCEAHRWWFNSDENENLERINNMRLKADFADGIRDYLLRLSPANRAPHYTLYQIATDMLKIQPERLNANSSAIGRALKVLGFTPDRIREGGSQISVHVVPEDLVKAPKRTPLHLQVVKSSEEEPK